jgi:tetratricopeptide (TPR) repeat protein
MAMDAAALSKFRAYSRFGKVEDLNEAIQIAQDIIQETCQTHPCFPGLQTNLGVMLQSRFERVGRMEDIHLAIHLGRSVLDATDSNDPNYAVYLDVLANRLQRRFECSNELSDLEEAIQISRKALEKTTPEQAFWPTALKDLSVKLARSFERKHDVQYLDEAIQLAELAVSATSKVDTQKAEIYHNLANMYDNRFSMASRDESLTTAIEYATCAVEMTPNDHPNYGDVLNGLSALLYKRFMLKSNPADLDDAISKSRESIAATPNNHPYLAGCLVNLGHKLWKRFEQTGRVENLNEALQRVREGIARTPEDSRDWSMRLNSLGAILQALYERSKDMEHLDAAIVALRTASQKTPQDDAREPIYLTNLGSLLMNRFDITNNEDDLKQGIEAALQAVELTDSSHRGQASHWNNLGIGLEKRFRMNKHTEDLEAAILYGRKSVDATAKSDVQLPGRLNNLGHRLWLSKHPTEDNEALSCFMQSWNCPNAVPFHRVDAARQIVRSLKERCQWKQAGEIASQAIDLLPIMNNLSLSPQDQQHVASKLSGLVSEACSLALHTGASAESAVTLLERGRGSIMSLLIDDRSDIASIKASYPEEAGAYESVRAALNAGREQTVQQFDAVQPNTVDYLDLARELDNCIARIRKLPGSERFLMSSTPEELKSCASDGPVIVVNVTDLRADAIIISATRIGTLPLPRLSFSEACSFLRSGSGNYKPPPGGFNPKRNVTIDDEDESEPNFLSWLWSNCVKLVLEELLTSGVTAPGEIPRIWWIGTGIASTFPFHAAGDFSVGVSENTLSQTIPSYTPTLKALAHSRAQALKHARPIHQDGSILIVTMPTTPGQQPLQGVGNEKYAIKRACDGIYNCKYLEYPSVTELLANIKGSDIIHFACHGTSDPVDPFNSHLLLQQSSTANPTVDRLTVADISKVDTLGQVWIAYLSACSTAEVKAKDLGDESLHISSAFQVIGIPHVIGSLWSVKDHVCVRMAELFYSNITSKHRSQDINRAVAEALHTAVLQVRKEFYNNPSAWAAFIHSGA